MTTWARFGMLGALATLLGGAACGDDFSTGTFPEIGIKIDGLPSDLERPVVFPQAIQLPISKEVTVENVGTKDLKVTSINWEIDETTGQPKKNPYVEIDFLGGVDANSFPMTITPDPLDAFSFRVKYTPPAVLDDTRESVLLIKSNARTDSGNKKNDEVRVVFAFNVNVAVPRVSPDNYVYRAATPSRPESQDFRIYNDSTATMSFRVLSVRLENNNPEFTLRNPPSQGAEVLAPGDQGYQDLVFSVMYAPTDNTPDTNAILIETDVTLGGVLRVPLSSQSTLGSYSLSFDHPSAFDFTNVSQAEKRNVLILSEGPGPITLRTPVIEPPEARTDYVVTSWTPATEQGGSDTPATYPKVLPNGRSLRIEVEYKPAVGSDTANGTLEIPVDDLGTIVIDLFSGEPKSKIVLAPSTGNVSVSGSVVAGDKGTRKVIVYNEGNGPLSVSGLRVLGAFDLAPKVWSLAEASAAFTVEPGGLEVIELDYDLAGITTTSGTVSESLFVDYHNDFLDEDTSVSIGLIASEAQGNANPTAVANGPTGGVVGEAFELTSTGSAPGGGTFVQNPYIWYVTGRPAGSSAKLNTQGSPSVSFTPDAAGTYTFELVVYSTKDDLYLYSAPATVSVTVTE
ncbi:MAG: hypothetical protein IT385_07790 [Deltaproteobacteria bacterium]|nr:hypothetical protein [Deltaproteobacteria bacterium]